MTGDPPVRSIPVTPHLAGRYARLAANVPMGSHEGTGPMHWRIVQCGHQQDRQVAEGIATTLGIETYAPQVREQRKVPARKLSRHQRSAGIVIMRPAEVPFLPGYVFARLPDEPPLRLFDVPGVIGILARADRTELIIPETFIANLHAREVGGIIPGATPPEMIFLIGDQVRVTDGPFTNRLGKVAQLPSTMIERIDADTRLRIIIDLFGRHTPVELTVGQVQKVHPR